MPRAENQKLKLLILKQIFETETDENHPLNAQQLIELLAKYGIRAERKSIYSDIECLRDFGLDIEQRLGANGGCYLASRAFELPELKLLVDAVQSSKFLSEKKSLQLIAKLETLASRYDAKSLRRQVVVSGRVKTMNESIYYNVDRIHEAIAQNSQITFRYFDWGVDKQRHYRDRKYQASPYALCWDNENYYLIAHSERHGLTHYRVDKMDAIRQTGIKRYTDDVVRKLDLSQYGKNVFSMYSGDARAVKLRFENALSGVVLDRFGRESMLIPDGENHFLFTTEITLSPVFFGWLFEFGSRVKILYPESVAQEFAEFCRQTLAQYE